MSTPSIAVVGSANVDMILQTERLPAPGETVLGGRFSTAAGGKGANQAVAAARLGGRVALVAKIGADPFGDQLLAGFHREGIDTTHVTRERDEPTGVAMIVVDAAGENSIAVASGANARLHAAAVDEAGSLIEASAVLLLQLEVPRDAVLRAAAIAARAGRIVILDPAPASPLEDELLRCVTYLTPNAHEAAALTGLPVHDEPTARRAAAALRAAGASHVIITLGAQGALLATPEGDVLIPSDPVSAIDTTAAGDAFNGAMAVALGRGLSAVDAVREACSAAALSTTRLGAQPSLPTREELERWRRGRAAN